MHGYADDRAFRGTFPASFRAEEEKCIQLLSGVCSDVTDWMNRKRLKTKDSKTEFIRPMLGYAVQLRKCITNAIHIEEEIIQRSMQIKYLAA